MSPKKIWVSHQIRHNCCTNGVFTIEDFIRRTSKFLLICLLIFVSPAALAQLCDGSLGDPVVNITFGDNQMPSSFVPSSGYRFTTSGCPDDGYYTIIKNTADCFGKTWHTVTSDHTGGGAFMLVNASYEPGDFFLTTVRDLCPNTTYEFAAWVMNIMKGANSILPNLIFKVETPLGEVLNSFTTGGLPITSSPQWNQYGFYFTTPIDNPEIVLRITNIAPGGIGNDLALDDITFRPCGSKIPAAFLNLNTDTVNLCYGETANQSFTLDGGEPSGYLSPLYQWQYSSNKGASWADIPGANSLHYQTPAMSDTGNYSYRLTIVESSVADISSCRIASDVLSVIVHPKPVVDAGPDRVMLADRPVSLAGKAQGEALSYVWKPDLYLDDPHRPNPQVSPPSDMIYTLEATSGSGCQDSDQVYVKVVSDLYIPNAFTPNGDGINDIWQIPFLDPSFEGDVKVYNRWGQMVYQSYGKPVSWDGTFRGEAQPVGVYSYYLRIQKYNFSLKGHLVLIR